MHGDGFRERVLKQFKNSKNNFENWGKNVEICRKFVNLEKKIGNIEKYLKIGKKFGYSKKKCQINVWRIKSLEIWKKM